MSKQNHITEQSFNVIKWLNNYEPKLKQLDSKSIKNVTHFSLIWNLFERQICGRWASINNFETKINKYRESDLLRQEEFQPFLDYFIKRYISNGEVNEQFYDLSFRNGDRQDLVISVLKKNNQELSSVVLAMLIIVYRYRNNLFHGNKWVYNLKHQEGNFNISNRLLAKLLEIDKNSKEHISR